MLRYYTSLTNHELNTEKKYTTDIINDMDHRADRLGLHIKWRPFKDFVDANKNLNPTEEYCIYLKKCCDFILVLEKQYKLINEKKMIDFSGSVRY